MLGAWLQDVVLEFVYGCPPAESECQRVQLHSWLHQGEAGFQLASAQENNAIWQYHNNGGLGTGKGI